MNDKSRARRLGLTRATSRSATGSAAARVPGALAQLAVLLRTPAGEAEPLFAQAPRAWQRTLPYVVVGIFVATLLPVTITVLTNDYKAGGGWSGALGVAQTVPLLLAVTRPLPAWVLVLVADALGAFLLLSSDAMAGRA